nr:LD-carboxypeptidase [Tenacibaculum pelagium]
MKLVKPPYLQKGDTIAIVAPAGILKNRKHIIDKAKALAESWGLKVVYGKHMFNQNHHFAGTDAERCQDVQDALDNSNIKAIWSARGGYGSVRILDQLDFTKFKDNPKWVVGYSDITAFHNHIHNLGIETIHGMMGTSMQDKPEDIPETIETLRKALFGEELKHVIQSSKYNREGKVTGQLVGGNIAILASMLGSDSQILTNGKILFIEEIGEYKYSIDRMLQSLKRAGYFTKVKGVIVGDMTKVKKNTTPWGSSIEQLILDIVPDNIPVLFNFPAGHEPDNRALIMGGNTKLSIKKYTSEVEFK